MLKEFKDNSSVKQDEFDLGYLLSLKAKQGFAKKRRELIHEVYVLDYMILSHSFLTIYAVKPELNILIEEKKAKRTEIVKQIIGMSVV